MNLPLLPPWTLKILDALHIRVLLRTSVFGFLDFCFRLKIPFIRWTIRRLEKRIRTDIIHTGRPIKVCFIAINPAQWTYQSIYDAMKRRNNFKPYVLLCFDWTSTAKNASKLQANFFESHGINTINNLDPKDPPDIIFFPKLADKSFSGDIELRHIYHSALCCSLFYSLGIDDSGAFYVYQPDFALTWKQFVPCEFYRQLATTRGLRHGENVVCSGSPKSDSLFTHANNYCAIWKLPMGNVKRIIYAPHWSIKTFGRMGNFDRYYDKFYDYLTTHSNVEIVLKPHPLLRARLSDANAKSNFRSTDQTFEDVDCLSTPEEYDAFVKKWCSLPNASYMDSGDYNGLFASSDAMILDSVSFMAEYMVTNKPMCFCVRESLEELQSRMKFNEFGKDLQSAMTIAPDWMAIVDFIENIVVKGEDPLKTIRKEMIAKHLSVNKGRVGEFIADEIQKSLLG